MRYVLTIFIFFALFHTVAQAASFQIVNPKVLTGDALILKFDHVPKHIIFNRRAIIAFPYQNEWRGIAPVPLSTKAGLYRLVTELADGTVIKRTITVAKKRVTTVTLPPPPKLGLTPKEIVKNLAATNTAIRKIVQEIQNKTRFSKPFSPPLSGNWNISSPFGEVRKIGEEKVTHLGTDFNAPKGSVVAAINAGTVKKAYFDPIYGNAVIINHGRGIYSLYLHLDELNVKAGDQVDQGTRVGTVGDSGLASAAHLHLSIKINGFSVDPIRFISSFR